MKRATLEATDENILNSIKNNTYNRVTDVRDFIEALDTIEGNMFISLDGKWGEGKTFYVRQIEKSLEYLTKRTWEDDSTRIAEELKKYFADTLLNSINLKQSYLPIYYNAWLYDNHDDPLMSLVLNIVKKSQQFFDTNTSTTIGQKIAALISAVSITFDKVQVAVDSEKMRSAFSGRDILENVKTAEEIRQMVRDILDVAIIEKAQRLVIFIDELDRCKPSFAIEMLERIKHYFDDERIIFVASVNKEQLIHTISKYYGEAFDSTGYLNKFFDLNIHMPALSKEGVKSSLFDARIYGQHHLMQIADGLNEYYRLTIRDSILFKQRVANLPVNLVNDNSAQGCCLSLFVPIIAILDIVDEKEKIKFLNGDSDIIETVSFDISAIHKMICRFGNPERDQYLEGFDKIQAVYHYAFKNMDTDTYNKLVLDVSFDFKIICMKLCNGFMKQ